jgi:Zn-dependent protease
VGSRTGLCGVHRHQSPPAFFNLIPIPPLDGGNVLAGLLPHSADPLIAFLRQWGFVVLYALMLTGVLNAIIEPPTAFFQRILVP